MPLIPLTRRIVPWLRLAAVLFLLASFASAEKPEDLRPSNYVNDFAGVLSPDTEDTLNALCLEVQQKANAQIAVVTVKTLEDESVEDFAVTLYKQWGIGAKGTDRGVLILLATLDHKYRVEVGYGLEGILPDGKVGGFGREMVPILGQGDFAGALKLITARIAQTIAADAHVELTGMPELPQRHASAGGNIQLTLGQKILFGIIALVILFILITHPSLLFWILLNSLGGGGSGGGGGFGGGDSGGFGGFGGGSSGGGGASGSW